MLKKKTRARPDHEMQWEHQIRGISTIMFKECYCGSMSKVMQSVNSAKLCSHVWVQHVEIDMVVV